MVFKRTPSRTSRRFSFGGKTSRFAFQAKYATDQWFRDGEDAGTTGLSPAVNTTNSLLLGAFGDFTETGNDSGWAKNVPRLKRIIFKGLIAPSEAGTQSGAIDWQWWFIMCPSAINTDWTTNTRDPNDVGLGVTASAFPHKLLKTGLVQMRTVVGSQALLFPARINVDIKSTRGIPLPFPYNLYFMAKPIIVDDAAGGWSAGEISFTWNVAIKAMRPNIS